MMHDSIPMIKTRSRTSLVHSDAESIVVVDSYFVTFTDDYSRCASVYFIKHKTEVFKKFKLFKTMVTQGVW